MFTKEQIETLKEFEPYFRSATVANYVRNIQANKLQIIIENWERASGEIIKERMSCGVCQLNFFKRVGKQYFEDKKQYQEESRKEREETQAQEETPKPKKRTTKKKTTA